MRQKNENHICSQLVIQSSRCVAITALRVDVAAIVVLSLVAVTCCSFVMLSLAAAVCCCVLLSRLLLVCDTVR